MSRSLPLLFAGACLTLVSACGDSDDDVVSALTVSGVTLTTSEDTQVAGAIAAAGAKGALRIEVAEAPSHGTITLNAASFVYDPALDYAGADRAVIRVSDDERSVTAVVAVTITAVNDPPRFAAAPALTIDEDTSVHLTLAKLGISDVDTDAARLAVAVANGNGYLVSDGTIAPLPNLAGTLTIPLTVSDGAATVPATLTLTVTPLNDAPDARVPSPRTTPFETPFTFSGDARVNIVDVDAATMGVELSADHGTITLSTTEGLSFAAGDGNDDASMTFSGTFTAVNAALAGFVVTPASGFDELITLTIIANDGGSSGAGGALTDSETFSLAVDDADVPPFNTIPDVVTVAEDATFTFQGVDILAVTDANAGGAATVDVVLTVVHGVVTLAGTSGLSFTEGDGNPSQVLRFSGTFANVNAALDGLTYRAPSDYAGADTLQFVTTSDGLTDTDACAITVAAVNDPPEITGPASPIDVATAAVVTFAGANTITVADLDAGNASVALTVTASAGTFGFTGTPTSAVDDATPGQVVMTGTLAQLTADVALLEWDAGAFSGSATLTFVIDDLAATGSGGARTDTYTLTINVASPALAANPDRYNVQGNVPRVVAAPGVLANDAPAGATVTTISTTSTLGGTVTMSANGAFTYTPPLGIGGRQQDGGVDDSFTYTITSPSGGSATGTVDITIFRVIWFVDKDHAGPTRDGSFTAPFATIEEAAAQTSHYGTYIYVYAAATPYVTDATLRPGTSLLSSHAPFDLQDGTEPPLEGESYVDGYASDSTELPALGRPTLVPVGATALRLGDTSRISGFDIDPGTVTTGPAIEAIAGNSGVIDNVTIDGFATGIRVIDTTTDRLELNNLVITDASDAVDVSTGEASGLSVISCLFERVQRGLTVDAAASATNARLSMYIVDLTVRAASDKAVLIRSATAAGAIFPSDIHLLFSSFINSPASGTSAIDIGVTGGSLEMELENLELAGYANGLTFDVADAAVNAALRDVDLGSGTFDGGGYRMTGSGAGRLDLTVEGLNGAVPNASGIVVTPGPLEVCLDLSTSSVSGNPTGLALTQSAGAFELEAYAGGDVATYFSGRFTGGVTAAGTFTTPAGGVCTDPPF